MAATVEEPTLVLLRRIDGNVGRLARDMLDVKEWLAAVELGLAGVCRKLAGLAEADARLNVRMDGLETRFDRIECRLEIAQS